MRAIPFTMANPRDSFLTLTSSPVPSMEGLCSLNPFGFVFSGFHLLCFLETKIPALILHEYMCTGGVDESQEE